MMDECAARVRSILQTRYDEIEDLQGAINDRYSLEDLFLKLAEVDNEEEIISRLIECLEGCTGSMKEKVISETNNAEAKHALVLHGKEGIITPKFHTQSISMESLQY